MPGTLKELMPGQEACIGGYREGFPDYRKKLLALGLTRGVTVKLIKIAPLGDPVEVEVRGYKLTLRKREADILLLKEPS